MLRLPPLQLLQPTSLDEALGLLAQHGASARLIAGGTDLLPNLKLGPARPDWLISLQRVAGFDGVRVSADGGLEIGAGTRLQDVADDAEVRARAPALASAAAVVASPQIRAMATLGGNLCVDTRCRYINQSELFRDALGGCLKSHGSECHVVPGGQGCVAALSSDTAPALIALQGVAVVVGPAGERRVPIGELYDTDGLAHVRLAAGEILWRVEVPMLAPGSAAVHRKWAVRKAIDFSLVSVAVRLDREPMGARALVGGVVAVAVLGPRPRVLDLRAYAGRSVDDALARELGKLAFDRSKTLPNVPFDPVYRRERLAVEVRRAVLSLA